MAKPSVGTHGPGYNIQAAVPTQPDQSKGVVAMNAYYNHATGTSNPFGCLGIITDPKKGGNASAFTKVSDTIANSKSVSLTIKLCYRRGKLPSPSTAF